MRKFFSVNMLLAVCVLVSALSMTSCAQTNMVNVYNWGDYIDESIVRSFTEETGIRVNYTSYSRNEEMYEKVKRDPSGYDVIFPSDHMIYKMIDEGLLEKLDFANIPNFVNLDKRFLGQTYDPHDEYSVPYFWGTMGILYNTTMVSEPIDSWDVLWDQKYKGEIFMYDSMRDVIAVAQKRLGYSVNDRDGAHLEAVKSALFAQKPLTQAYVDETIKDKMIGREGALALVYSGDAFFGILENDELDFVVPKEGSIVWYDSMVVPKGAKHKTEAEAFINYLCRPDIAQKNAEYVGYSTTNAEAYKGLPADWRDSEVYWATDDILERCEVMLDLGRFNEEVVKAWTEILAVR